MYPRLFDRPPLSRIVSTPRWRGLYPRLFSNPQAVPTPRCRGLYPPPAGEDCILASFQILRLCLPLAVEDCAYPRWRGLYPRLFDRPPLARIISSPLCKSSGCAHPPLSRIAPTPRWRGLYPRLFVKALFNPVCAHPPLARIVSSPLCKSPLQPRRGDICVAALKPKEPSPVGAASVYK